MAGVAAALCVAAVTSVAVAVAVFILVQPASPWVGGAAGAATLRARDRTGERDASTVAERLARLGVGADVHDVAREGAVVEVRGAADVQAAVHAVLEPGRLAVYAEAPPVEPGAVGDAAGDGAGGAAADGGGAAAAGSATDGSGSAAGSDAAAAPDLTPGSDAAAAPDAAGSDAASPDPAAAPTGPRSRVLEDCAAPPCAPIQVLLPPVLSNRDLADVTRDGTGLTLTWTADGALQFEALTQRQIGRRVVIAIDDRVYAAPVVAARDHGGQVRLDAPDAELLRALLLGNPLAGRWEIVSLAPR